jgi:hypothetical protein
MAKWMIKLPIFNLKYFDEIFCDAVRNNAIEVCKWLLHSNIELFDKFSHTLVDSIPEEATKTRPWALAIAGIRDRHPRLNILKVNMYEVLKSEDFICIKFLEWIYPNLLEKFRFGSIDNYYSCIFDTLGKIGNIKLVKWVLDRYKMGNTLTYCCRCLKTAIENKCINLVKMLLNYNSTDIEKDSIYNYLNNKIYTVKEWYEEYVKICNKIEDNVFITEQVFMNALINSNFTMITDITKLCPDIDIKNVFYELCEYNKYEEIKWIINNFEIKGIDFDRLYLKNLPYQYLVIDINNDISKLIYEKFKDDIDIGKIINRMINYDFESLTKIKYWCKDYTNKLLFDEIRNILLINKIEFSENKCKFLINELSDISVEDFELLMNILYYSKSYKVFEYFFNEKKEIFSAENLSQYYKYLINIIFKESENSGYITEGRINYLFELSKKVDMTNEIVNRYFIECCRKGNFNECTILHKNYDCIDKETYMIGFKLSCCSSIDIPCWIWSIITEEDKKDYNIVDLFNYTLNNQNIGNTINFMNRLNNNLSFLVDLLDDNIRTKVLDKEFLSCERSNSILQAQWFADYNSKRYIVKTSFEKRWDYGGYEYYERISSLKINRIINDKCENGETCGICFEDCSNVKTKCGHSFCYGCINKWFDRGNETCPYCRTSGNNHNNLISVE